jgi:hypothetical protein
MMRAACPARRRREAGVLLLAVALLLAILAALAFGLGRAAGMDLQAVNADYERRNAAYLAAGGFAAAKWYNQAKCGNAAPPSMTLAGATLSMTVTKGKAHQIAITATATTAAGASSTLADVEIDIYNFANVERKTLGGAFQDTYIYAGQGAAMNGNAGLALADQSYALLSWATTDIPKDSKVLAATLALVASGAGITTRTVNLHRVTTQWDAAATWTRPRPMQTWNGGDYDPLVIDGTGVLAAGTYTWDATTLVDAWYNGTQSNYGMLLRLAMPGQSVTFNSREAPIAQQLQPALNVSFSKSCP